MLSHGLTRAQANLLYDTVLADRDADTARELCLNDLFFLLTRACKRRDIDNDWLFARCREVEANPDGYLDLWAREHYKSTIITFGKSIQDLLRDPNGATIGIFSHTRPIAKGFVDQIKRELESNSFLKDLFPDVLYQNPTAESPKWSLDSGLIVKRESNPKEASIEAWGLVDGQPTSKHFSVLVFDDVVTRESVTTPDQIKKVTQAFELSLNLGAKGGKRRIIGTRYHANDSYRTMIDRGTVIARIYPATDNGKLDGRPVFLTAQELAEKRRDMGPYIFSTQMLQDPLADKAMGFKEEWPKYYEKIDHSRWNKYILVDPASKKKSTSDYTTMAVIGCAPDGNYYLVSGLRDRLNLTQRTQALFNLHRTFKPLAVGYEQYGMQSDIEHINYVMEQENYRFSITEVGGGMAKEDRIRRLVPAFEQGRFYLPNKLPFKTCENEIKDFVSLFINDEFVAFPVSTHDDMLDCISRIFDINATFPLPEKPKPKPSFSVGGSSSWMG